MTYLKFLSQIKLQKAGYLNCKVVSWVRPYKREKRIEEAIQLLSPKESKEKVETEGIKSWTLLILEHCRLTLSTS